MERSGGLGCRARVKAVPRSMCGRKKGDQMKKEGAQKSMIAIDKKCNDKLCRGWFEGLWECKRLEVMML